jgi:hypothetical protein
MNARAKQKSTFEHLCSLSHGCMLRVPLCSPA